MDEYKKQQEGNNLDYFIEAYEYATGIKIEQVEPSETPDFIWHKDDGTKIGIEVTRIQRSPEEAVNDKVFDNKLSMDTTEAYHQICAQIERKNGLASDKLILVLQLMETNIHELIPELEAAPEDFAKYDYMEIWIADHTGIEAYADVELFCLHPPEYWGFYERSNPTRKPYG